MATITKWIRVGIAYIFTAEKPPRLVADVSLRNWSVAEIKANANLIAAAPEMHWALTEVVKELHIAFDSENCEHDVGICFCGTRHMIDNAEQALAKAEEK